MILSQVEQKAMPDDIGEHCITRDTITIAIATIKVV